MQFNSLAYILFLPAVAVLYFLAPVRLKNPVLLVASYFFYMNWNAVYALLMLASTAMTYASGLLIAKATRTAKKNGRLGFALPSTGHPVLLQVFSLCVRHRP
jgi:D-alanyl-lipoteichoic acid acyltransferase DltB (MBOAT superfamily)